MKIVSTSQMSPSWVTILYVTTVAMESDAKSALVAPSCNWSSEKVDRTSENEGKAWKSAQIPGEDENGPEERLSSQRQRIFKALITDDIIINNGGDIPYSTGRDGGHGSSSSSSRSSSCDGLTKASSFENLKISARHKYEEEMNMRVQDNMLDLRDENRENSDSLEEMDAAIYSLRRWQEERLKKASELESALEQEMLTSSDRRTQIPQHPQFDPGQLFALEPNAQAIGLEAVTRDDGGDMERYEEPLSARTANKETIASLKSLISAKHEYTAPRDDDVMRRLDLQEKRVLDAASRVKTNQEDDMISNIESRKRGHLLPEMAALENKLSMEFLELEGKAEILEDSLRQFDQELNKYL